MPQYIPPGLGWHRDLPDFRDYSPTHRPVSAMLEELKRPKSPRVSRLRSIDWREYCPPVENQGKLASCSAHACVGLVEYFERRASGEALSASRLFLYKMTRRLLQSRGDTGADLRTTLKAMIRFGIPPERYWPYEAAKCEDEPDPFLFSFGQEFQSIVYVRLDPCGATGAQSLKTVKSFLAAGFTSVLGFTVTSSVSQEADIPLPTSFDRVRGGHAVTAVGYNDDRRIRSTKGALLIRNSWGTDWGEDGYGWLPYSYIEERLAADFWTVLKPEWLSSGEFEQPD